MPPPPYATMSGVKDKAFRFDLHLRLVQDARKLGIKETARRWDCSRNTVRRWLRRYESEGRQGLQERSHAPQCCPHKTPAHKETQIVKLRQKTGYGARRLEMEFQLDVSHNAIHRILQEHQLVRKRKSKRQKKNDLRAVKAKLRAFEKVMMDVKYLNDIAHYLPQMRLRKLPKFQYTLRDVRTGLMFLAFGNELSKTHACVAIRRFLAHLQAHGIDLTTVSIQTDNGTEFDGQTIKLSERGFISLIREQFHADHCFIPPACPNANADVETVHNLTETEFYEREDFADLPQFLRKAGTYQDHFNLTRKNSYQNWRTPLQRLREAAPVLDPRLVLLPPVLLDTLLPKAPESTELSTTDQMLINLRGGQHQPGHPDFS